MPSHIQPFVSPAAYERQLDPSKREIRLLRWVNTSEADEDTDQTTLETVDKMRSEVDEIPDDNAEGYEEGDKEEALPTSLDFVLEYYSLEDGPEFIALSYEWGDASWKYEEEGLSTSVNGRDVHLTANLVQALRYSKDNLDHPWHHYFWVDALCINQQDNQEKGHQVQMMREIYQKARGVEAWIGMPYNDSKLAFSFLNAMNFRKYPGNSRVDFEKAIYSSLRDPSCKPIWLALLSLCGRSYWRRSWIIQELVVNRQARMKCGRDFAQVFDLWRIFEIINTPKLTVEPELSWILIPKFFLGHNYDLVGKGSLLWDRNRQTITLSIFRDYHFGQRVLGTLDIFLLLVIYSQQEFKIPRDRFYSLLGICTPYEHGNLEVDYECTEEKAYIDLARHIIRGRQSFDILQCCSLREKRTANYPSWVPTWDNSPEDKSAISWEARNWNAGGKTIVYLNPNGGLVLAVATYVLGAIHDSSPVPGVYGSLREFSEYTKVFSFLHRLRQFMLGSSGIDVLSQTQMDENLVEVKDTAFDILSVLHCSVQHHDDFPYLSASDCQELLSALFPTIGDLSPHAWNLAIQELTESPVEELLHWGPQTLRIFNILRPAELQSSQRKYLFGTTNADLKDGDLAAVIEGCKSPIVLRPTDQEAFYQVISVAYVGGVMNGEVLDTLPRQAIYLV